MRSYKPEEPTN